MNSHAQDVVGVSLCARKAFSVDFWFLFRIQSSTIITTPTSSANPPTAPPTTAASGTPVEVGEVVGVVVCVTTEFVSDAVDVVNVELSEPPKATVCALLQWSFISQGG